MKFQYKALVAAIALSAATLPAQAAMTLATSGNSSLILTLLDNTTNTSALFDLGYDYATFQSTFIANAYSSGTLAADGLTKSFSIDLTGGNYSTAWTSFWSAASAADVKWAVYAADGTGSGVGSRGLISTYSSGDKVLHTNALQTTIGNYNSYMTNNNNPAYGNHSTVENGASVVTGTTGAAYAGNAFAYGSTGKINATGFVATGALDTSLNVVQQLSGAAANSPVTLTTLGGYGGNFQFKMNSNGLLDIVVPVPEADSYAMLLAGLGVIGLVARRRKA